MRLRNDVLAVPVSADSTLIASEFERFFVHGMSAEALYPGVDASRMDPDLSSALATRGLLVCDGAGEHQLPKEQGAHWESMGIHQDWAARRLRQSSVRISGAVEFSRSVTEILRQSGVASDERAGLQIVGVPDYLDASVIGINDESLLSRQPWTIAKPWGRQLWIGPIFLPGDGACWACLRHRLVQNRWTDAAVWRAGASMPAVSVAQTAAHVSLAASILSAEVLRFLVTGKSELTSSLLTVDTFTWQIQKHPVERRRECPRCAYLGRPKLWSEPHRSEVSLADVRARNESSLTGFLHGMRGEGRQWQPFHIATAVVVPPLNARATFADRSPLRASGVGLSPDEAEQSCVGEAVERYSLFARGDEPCVRATVGDMGDRGIHPSDLWQFSATQYAEAAGWNALQTPECTVPEELWSKHPIEWLEGRNYTGGECTYVPAGYALLSYSDYDASYCIADSTGAAAAQTPEQAVLAGLLEVVERDAAAIWWYNRLFRPGLDGRSIEGYQTWLKWIADRGRTLHLLDLTTDWEVPVVAAVSALHDGSQVLYATAAALDYATAGAKAVFELIQMLFASTMSDFPPMKARWLATQTLAMNPYLSPVPGAMHPCLARRADLSSVLKTARTLGLQVVAIDLTRSDTAVPVMKVCVPGMRSAARRMAPGRLYDLPVQMGWLPAGNTEETLNPWPFLL